jgi:glycosyltransferase involved in cell wall biosynthesis
MANSHQAGYAVSSPNDAPPLVSIIVAVFNGKTTLPQCIDSVEQQTYSNKELIVVDGGSTDGTVDLLKQDANKISAWISEADCGIYNAWNKGLALAQGEWICFLGADDYFWDATVLERMSEHLKMLPQAIRVAYGQIMLVDIDGQSIRLIGQPWEQLRETFKQYMCMPHVGTMQRRALFEQHGNFDESFQIAGDYEWLLRELNTGDAAFVPDIIVAGQRLGGISTHSKNNLRIKLEVWRAKRKHSLPLQWGAVLWEIGNEYLQLVLCKVLGESQSEKLIAQYRRIKRWFR